MMDQQTVASSSTIDTLKIEFKILLLSYDFDAQSYKVLAPRLIDPLMEPILDDAVIPIVFGFDRELDFAIESRYTNYVKSINKSKFVLFSSTKVSEFPMDADTAERLKRSSDNGFVDFSGLCVVNSLLFKGVYDEEYKLGCAVYEGSISAGSETAQFNPPPQVLMATRQNFKPKLIIGSNESIPEELDPNSVNGNVANKFLDKLKGRILTGEVIEPSSDSDYSVRLEVDGEVITVSYPELSCGGTWSLESTGGNTVRFREKIEYGQNKCTNNGRVAIEVRNGVEFYFMWSSEGNSTPEAWATLREALPTLTGEWMGFALSGASKVEYYWNIKQSGSDVSGEISLRSKDYLEWRTYAFVGQIGDDQLTFSGTDWLSENTEGYCLAAGTLNLFRVDRSLRLIGEWGYNPVSGGCPQGAGGEVSLSNMKPDP